VEGSYNRHEKSILFEKSIRKALALTNLFRSGFKDDDSDETSRTRFAGSVFRASGRNAAACARRGSKAR
jgi:hypothetical protein